MATPLSHSDSLRLDQALSQWQHWATPAPLPERPKVSKSLEGGRSNHSWLVEAGEQAFVLRLDGLDPARHGISRQGEWRALHLANSRGLAPAPRYFNPALGALVCDYLPPSDTPSADTAEIAALLRNIHALPRLRHRLRPSERIARYRHQCQQAAPALLAELAPFDTLLSRCIELHDANPEPPVLCHNDLLAANRLCSSGQLWAIDWEYCAMGSRWFELAVIICGDRLTAAARESLLQHYLQRKPTASERGLLAAAELIYAFLEILWYGANGQATELCKPCLETVAKVSRAPELAFPGAL